MIHSVIVSYERVELTEIAVKSYLSTVQLPYSLLVVDSGSSPETVERLHDLEGTGLLLLPENRYPGFATNRGWEVAPATATILHRGDNDFAYLPGWDVELVGRFEDLDVGQVGLRTDEEELHHPTNVGGNNAIRRSLFDAGLRYDERPWGVLGKGITEDSLLSPAVSRLGFSWTRVSRPCIYGTSVESASDPYYERSWRARGIFDEVVRQLGRAE